MKKKTSESYTIRAAENNEGERTLLLAEMTQVFENGTKLNQSQAYASPADFAKESMFMIERGLLSDQMLERETIKTLHITITCEWEE